MGRGEDVSSRAPPRESGDMFLDGGRRHHDSISTPKGPIRRQRSTSGSGVRPEPSSGYPDARKIIQFDILRGCSEPRTGTRRVISAASWRRPSLSHPDRLDGEPHRHMEHLLQGSFGLILWDQFESILALMSGSSIAVQSSVAARKQWAWRPGHAKGCCVTMTRTDFADHARIPWSLSS